MKNVTLHRTTILQFDVDATDSALDAAATVTSCAITLPSTCAPLPIKSCEARNSPSIRPKICAGPVHSILPTIDMPEPMQESVPAFGIGGLATTGSTTECCCCTIPPMTSVAFAAVFLSFSGALLLNLRNMSTSVFPGMQCRKGQGCRVARADTEPLTPIAW